MRNGPSTRGVDQRADPAQDGRQGVAEEDQRDRGNDRDQAQDEAVFDQSLATFMKRPRRQVASGALAIR